MKAIIAPIVCVSAFFFSVATASASSELKVEASRDLRVAVLDLSKRKISSDALNEAFGASLSASMTRLYGSAIPVQTTSLEFPQGPLELKMGSYDAVLVIGNDLPSAFRKADFSYTRMAGEVGAPAPVYYLVVRGDDSAFQGSIFTAFESAIAAPRFQEAANRAVAIKVTSDPATSVVKK